MADVDQNDASAGHREVRVAVRHDVMHEVAERARDLDAGRATSDDDERQRAVVNKLGLGVGVRVQLQYPLSHVARVGEAVERKGELVRTLGMEEVGLCTGCQHEVVAGDRGAVGQGHTASVEIGGDRIGLDRGDTALTAEHLGVFERDVLASQFSGGDLVEEWLELLVPVLVYQGDLGPGFLGERLGARHACETTANDHDLCDGLLPHTPMLALTPTRCRRTDEHGPAPVGVQVDAGSMAGGSSQPCSRTTFVRTSIHLITPEALHGTHTVPHGRAAEASRRSGIPRRRDRVVYMPKKILVTLGIVVVLQGLVALYLVSALQLLVVRDAPFGVTGASPVVNAVTLGALMTDLIAGPWIGAYSNSHFWPLLPCFILITAAVSLAAAALQRLVGAVGTLLVVEWFRTPDLPVTPEAEDETAAVSIPVGALP